MGDKGPSIDWPGLLRWSLKYSDGTHETTPLAKERLKFLEEAIRQAMSMYEDPNDLVIEAVRKLTAEETSDGDKTSALRLIERCVDDCPEISRQLDKLGALPVLLNLTAHPDSTISRLALQILSFALPNNHKIQLAIWNLGGLDTLMQGCDSPEFYQNPNRLGAISGLVRHAREIEDDFLARGGCKMITNALFSPNRKVQIKAANLLRHLCHEGVLKPGDMVEANLVLGLAHMMDHVDGNPTDTDTIQYAETCATALVAALKITAHLLKAAPVASTTPGNETEKNQSFSENQLQRVTKVIQERLGLIDSKGEDHAVEKSFLKDALSQLTSTKIDQTIQCT